jgi:alpha-L-arabinofuranosidase
MEEAMNVKSKKDPIVYVVWGPSPEWGDGVGPIGYATSKREARMILAQERRDEAEYGPRSWRTLRESAAIEPVPAAELGWDGTEAIEEFIDRLNQYC